MSLLEDVFLEDEAGEAQELERVIEGDEYDERPLSPNSDNSDVKEDEAEEEKRRVDPADAKPKRVIKNPRFILNPARLTGPRGIQVLPDHFKDFKFKGKGHEKDDLDRVLKSLEHWAYRLYPKFEFSDCLKKIETLGKKRTVMLHLHKIRSDQYLSEDTVVQKDSSDDEEPAPVVQEEDEFDKLLQQQIELARATPAPGSVKKAPFTPGVDRSFIMPKATSSPSINDEQRERMLRNRQLAAERKLAKLKEAENEINTQEVEIEGITKLNDSVTKRNRLNVIDSSDEDDSPIVNHNNSDDLTRIHNDNGNITKINDDILKKHNRSNAIDSSDEDEGPIIIQSVPIVHHNNFDDSTGHENESHSNKIIDVERLTKDEVRKRYKRSNIMDSSDDDDCSLQKEPVSINNFNDLIGNEKEIDPSKTVEIEGVTKANNNFTKKINRSNVLDSSDDDDNDNLIMNQRNENLDSLIGSENDNNLNTVIESEGVNNTTNNKTNSSAEDDSPVEKQSVPVDLYNHFDSNENKLIDSEVKDHIDKDDVIPEHIVVNDKNTSIADVESEIPESLNIDTINVEMETIDKKINKKLRKDSNTKMNCCNGNVTDENSLSSKENVSNNVVDEIMDVDFSEDF